MLPERHLRKQVETELKRKRYVLYTFLLLSLIYVVGSLFFGERGLMRYTALSQKESELRAEVNAINKENDDLRAVIESYENNEFYLEKHARENFGLAGPGEYIYRYEN
ncbi:MAG: septum formation initiator family protein [Nitrospirota bacterium]